MKKELIEMIGSIESEKAIRNLSFIVKDYLKSKRIKKEKIQSPIADQSKDCI